MDTTIHQYFENTSRSNGRRKQEYRKEIDARRFTDVGEEDAELDVEVQPAQRLAAPIWRAEVEILRTW